MNLSKLADANTKTGVANFVHFQRLFYHKLDVLQKSNYKPRKICTNLIAEIKLSRFHSKKWIKPSYEPNKTFMPIMGIRF